MNKKREHQNVHKILSTKIQDQTCHTCFINFTCHSNEYAHATFITFTALVIGLAACSSSAPKIEITEFEPGSCRFKQSEEVAPDWFCAPDEMFDDAYVYGVAPPTKVIRMNTSHAKLQ